jgi:hypothetical protein
VGTTSLQDAQSNSYMVLQDEDYGTGVDSEPRPYRMTTDRLDPIGDQRARSGATGLRVAVIGGGPTALLAAIEAVRNGAARVIVFEARDAASLDALGALVSSLAQAVPTGAREHVEDR